MAETRKLKVFLCHSKDDKPKVRDLYHRLVADGFDAWLDEEKLMPGQDLDLEIQRAVHEANVVVVCLSNRSITKAEYVQKEIRFALDVADEQPEGATFIIPARLEECEVPIRLSKWHWVDLFRDIGYERLETALTYQANKTGNLLIPASHLQNTLANFIEPQMVNILAGKFLMGSTEEQSAKAIRDGLDRNRVEWEQPQHTIELSEYSVGKYPITNREYQVFLRDTKFRPPNDWESDQFPTEKGNHPVINVSWNDANTYCKWLSEKSGKYYRLPTEAEWQKAARGEHGHVYPWGNDFFSKKANTDQAKIGNTYDVGKFSPQRDSPYGCADMVGNVWEWTSSLWGKNPRNPSFKYPYNANDGREDLNAGNDFLRVLCGGSLLNPTERVYDIMCKRGRTFVE